MKSVVGDRLQYIVHEEFGEVLYNWRDDPLELSDLAKEPDSATALESLRSYLDELIGSPIFK